jgi:hypothetical protein
MAAFFRWSSLPARPQGVPRPYLRFRKAQHAHFPDSLEATGKASPSFFTAKGKMLLIAQGKYSGLSNAREHQIAT